MSILAEIITIGDEILIGQTVDTNSAWMGDNLSKIGVDVIQITSISDEKSHILQALTSASKRSNIVLVTGGLGPTQDDITKHTLCTYFKTQLVRNMDVLQRIESFFTSRGKDMLEVNRQQADLPESAIIIDNLVGTASGMWFEEAGVVYVSMPGVPYEMKSLMTEGVLPKLKNHFQLPDIHHRTILTHGAGESFIADKICDWENRLRDSGLSLAYLPSTVSVKLRISSKDLPNGKMLIDQFERELHTLIPDLIFGYEKDTLQQLLGEALIKKGASLAIAESCTGGYIAHKITSVSGSSAYFLGSVVSYDNTIKQQWLDVSQDDLSNYGAVSESVVMQMANGIKEKMGADYAIATSGIAGPTGGTEEKPVGTIWIAVVGPGFEERMRFQFGNHRGRNVEMTANTAMNMLLKKICA